jgi:exopolysaccharide biosynthesis polyprenyl glycosylphosphotransferase
MLPDTGKNEVVMYKKINPGWIKHWDFEFLDIVCLEASFLIAYGLRHLDVFPYLPRMYLRLSVLLFAFDVVVVFLTNNYKGILERNKTQELWAVIQHVTVVELLLLLYEYVVQESNEFSRTVFFLSWGFGMFLCLMGRLTLKKVVRRRITSEKNQTRMMVLVGSGHVYPCIQQLLQKIWRSYKISAIALPNDTQYNDRIDANIPILFGKEQMMEYIRQGIVDEVYIDTFVDREDLNQQVDLFLSMGITVHIGMGFLPENLPNQIVEKMGDAYVVTTAIKTASGWQIALKRFMDIIGSLIGLLLTGIIFIFVAPAIKLASPGPVFFTQERIGKNGRPFKIYKFRSMHVDAEARQKELMDRNEMQGLMFKVDNDPRIIGSEKGPGKGIGNFIRKTSMDEFPQFWNVLKGDMSLVGTRPPTKAEYEQYALHHKIRLSMKPGITGLWQISGRSEITNFEEVVQLDTAYIENWTLVLDIKILVMTIGAVLSRKGSK